MEWCSLNSMKKYTENGKITVDDAAEELGITVPELEKIMNEAK